MSTLGTVDAASIAAPRPPAPGAVLRRHAAKALDLLVAFWIFCGSIVFFEPSPYEVSFLLVLGMAAFAGLGLFRSTLGLLAIAILFSPFALIAVFQVRTPLMDALIFSLVTIFLMLTSYFLANYVAEKTVPRMRLVIGAYTAAAVFSALLGTGAYLGVVPGADMFLLYGRARAAFNDPNVFGPFLVLPAMFALQRILLAPDLRRMLVPGLIYLVIFIGVFVSFSRAAWGHFAASSLIVLVLVYLLEAQAREKVRIMLLTLAGAGLLVIVVGGLLSIPAVSELFEVRASSQDYDTGETGRFGRQGYAFELALANPWGLGPGGFRSLRIMEEPHNVYVFVLHTYGWGGGLMFYVLVLATLWKSVRSVMQPSPYRLMAIPLLATFSMVMAMSALIDSDHWRHIYLLIGLVWGISSAIGMDRRRSAPRSEMLV